MFMKRRLVAAILFAILAFSTAFSQDLRGTLSGIVSDATASPVAGAKITVSETHTGSKVQLETDNTGRYSALSLLPGDYEISAQFEGFKEFIRKGVHLGAGEHPVIDITLQLGDAAQSVSVTADAPLINSENASVGQAITTKEVENLPLNGGTPLVLASLAIGVLATGQPSLIHPFDSGAAAGWSIGGNPGQTNEILINGSPDATWDGRLA